MLYTWGILLALLSVDFVLCKECDSKDSACVVPWANTVYPIIVKGGDNVGTSDPLHRDIIEAELPNFKYVFRNADFIGMASCSITKLEYNEDGKFESHLQCPNVIVKADHEAKGDIAGFSIDIKGSCTVTAEDTIYKFTGDMDITIGADGKKYIHVKKYEVDAKTNGHLVLDFKNDYDGSTSDFNTVQKFLNENWKEMDGLLSKPAVESFMGLYIDNLNAYMKVVPFEPFVPDD